MSEAFRERPVAGSHMNPEDADWPVGPKHGFTSDQVIAVLNIAITSEKWAASQKSLRETTFADWGLDADGNEITVPVETI